MELAILRPPLVVAIPAMEGPRGRVEEGDRAVPPRPPPGTRLLLLLREDLYLGGLPFRVPGPGRRGRGRRGTVLRRGGGEGGAAAAELDEQLRCGDLGGRGGRVHRGQVEGSFHGSRLPCDGGFRVPSVLLDQTGFHALLFFLWSGNNSLGVGNSEPT